MVLSLPSPCGGNAGRAVLAAESLQCFTAKAEGAEGTGQSAALSRVMGRRVEEGKYSTKEKSLLSLFAFEKESKRLMIIKGKLRRCIARCGISAPWDVLQAVLCMVWAQRCCGTELIHQLSPPPVPREVLGKEGSITHILRVPESTKLGVEITRRCPRVCVKESYFHSSCCEKQMPENPCPISQLNCLLRLKTNRLHSL